MLKKTVPRQFALSKRYAHAEYARGMVDVRYSYVKYAGHTWIYPGYTLMWVFRRTNVYSYRNVEKFRFIWTSHLILERWT